MELKAWTGWEALTGTKTTLGDLLEEIRTWPKGEVLKILSMLDVMLQNAQAQDPKTQLQLLHVVDEKLTQNQAVVRAVESHETAVFIELHRVSLTQLVLAYGGESAELPQERPNAVLFRSVLKGLLQVADISGAKDATEQGLIGWVLQAYPYFWRDSLPDQIVRSRRWYVELAPTVEWPNDATPIDFDAVLQRIFGLTMQEIYSALYGIFAFLVGQDRPRPDADFVPWTAYIGSRFWEQKPEVRRLLEFLAHTPDQFRDLWSDLAPEDLVAPRKELKTFPLVKLHSDLYFPISLSSLVNRLGQSMYYVILDNLPSASRSTFQDHMGRVFETWVKEKLGSVYHRDRLLLETTYNRRTKGERNLKTSEAIAVYPDINLMWEAKSKRIPALVFENADLNAFYAAVSKGIVPGIKQTYRVARDIEDGFVFHDQVVAHRYRVVVVTMEHYPQLGPLGKYLDDLCAGERPCCVKDHIILDAFAFELACRASEKTGADLSQVLDDWVTEWRQSNYILQFPEFMYRRYPEMHSEPLNSEFQRLMIEAATLFGLENSETSGIS